MSKRIATPLLFFFSTEFKPNTNEKKVALNLAPLLYCSFIILFFLRFSYLKIILEVPKFTCSFLIFRNSTPAFTLKLTSNSFSPSFKRAAPA